MKQGIHTISEELYHADNLMDVPTLSNSIAKILIEQSPQHAWFAHPRLNPNYKPVDREVFDFGRAAHSILLEKDVSKISFIPFDEYRTKESKRKRDEAYAKGLTPVKRKYERPLMDMVSSAIKKVKDSELAGIFQDGKPEQTLLWQEGDAWCRGRLDWLRSDNKVILDYKTTTSADPDTCVRKIASMGYDMQASFYKRGLIANGGSEDAIFVFLFQEIEPPYACCLIALSNTFIEIADKKVDDAIEIWTDCIKNGKWPSYSDQVHYAEPPNWMLQQYMAMMEES